MAWLTNWNYRKATTVSNTGSALTDYQVSITIDTATLVTAGKLLSSCNDIRFTSSDGSTLLNYWIESGPNTSSTKIWVKIPSIANGSNTIYLYYGNPSAASASNGTNTFDFFDDFSSGSIDTSKWTILAGSPSITGGILTIPAGGSIIRSTLTFASPLKLIFNSSYASTGGNSTSIVQGMYLVSTNERMYHYADKDGYDIMNFYKAGTGPQVTTNWTNGYATRKIAWDKTIPSIHWYQNDIESLASPMTTSSYIPIVSMPIHFESDGSASNINVDYVFITKLGLSEPTFSTIGSEEVLTGDLNISSTPIGAVGASVYIDGNGIPSGVTPLIITGFTPGTHTYRLTKTGYTEIPATNFSITAGQVTMISQAMLTVANITATGMTVTPSETPCRTGICTVLVSVTWTNSGQTAGLSNLSITVSGGTPTITPPSYSSVSFAANGTIGDTIIETFTVSGLSAGTHTICPNPN